MQRTAAAWAKRLNRGSQGRRFRYLFHLHEGGSRIVGAAGAEGWIFRAGVKGEGEGEGRHGRVIDGRTGQDRRGCSGLRCVTGSQHAWGWGSRCRDDGDHDDGMGSDAMR